MGRSKALYLTIESAEEDHRKLAKDLKQLLEPFLLDLADRLELDSKVTLRKFDKIHNQTLANTAEAASVINGLANDELAPASDGSADNQASRLEFVGRCRDKSASTGW